MKIKLPVALLIAYIMWFIALAINPVDRVNWASENAGIALVVLFLVITYKHFKFSDLAYSMMAFLIFLHTLGGHYTFENVPFDYITNFFGFERNNFDRLAHFTVGFYAFPVMEFVERRKLSPSKTMIALFAVFSILAFAAFYEIMEWLYAANMSPEAGSAFLGSQGDIWDAQKDMLADGLGAVAAVFIFRIARKTPQTK
jgi:putative membrane protein